MKHWKPFASSRKHINWGSWGTEVKHRLYRYTSKTLFKLYESHVLKHGILKHFNFYHCAKEFHSEYHDKNVIYKQWITLVIN